PAFLAAMFQPAWIRPARRMSAKALSDMKGPPPQHLAAGCGVQEVVGGISAPRRHRHAPDVRRPASAWTGPTAPPY
ncbi:hypothetical protein, partial [Diaphorobacter nitroreducens]|uniref:hypothetical protein n=1 Tax=Diaphorobacter nitroreducens TaxID=164759 RepID=UPI0028B06BB3